MMDQKKKVYLIAIAAVALVVICVLLAGLLDGYWPWDNDRDMGGGYTGGTTETTTGTTSGDLDIDVDDKEEGNFGVIDFDDLLNGEGGEASDNDENDKDEDDKDDNDKDDNDKDDNDKDDNDKDDNDKDEDNKDEDNKDEDNNKPNGGTQVEDGDIAIDF